MTDLDEAALRAMRVLTQRIGESGVTRLAMRDALLASGLVERLERAEVELQVQRRAQEQTYTRAQKAEKLLEDYRYELKVRATEVLQLRNALRKNRGET